MAQVQTTEPQLDIVPLGKWHPDAPDLPGSEGFRVGLNLIPRDDGSYGPEYALETFQSTAITAVGSALKFHGSLHSVPPGSTSDGEPRYYAGTFAAGANSSRLLSRLETGGWTDKSVVGGYNCNPFTPWRFSNFGNKVFAVNRLTNLQVSDGGSSLFRNVTDAPRAVDVATVRGFLVLINVNDTNHGEGEQPFYVWWSGIGNGESWPDPTSDLAISLQSAFRPLFGGGPLRRIIPGIGGADAIIIGARKMWRMRYVGPPLIFDFDEVEGDQGTNSPGTVAVLNETLFFFGYGHLYFFDGANCQRIGTDVDRFFNADATFSSTFGLQNAMEGAIDPENGNYVLTYRNSLAPDDHNNRVLRYNWTTGNWSNSEQAIDCLAQVDSNASTTDSPRIVYIGPDFQLKRPSLTRLAARIEGFDLMGPGGAVVEITGILPMCDAPNVAVTVKTRDFLSATPVTSPNRTLQDDGFIRYHPLQPTGRFYRCDMVIPAETWNAIAGVGYEWQLHSQGVRRSA